MAQKKINTDIVTVTNADSPYTVLISETIILCDSSGGAITLNLPSVVGKEGKKYVVKKTSAGANNITIEADGSEEIDGNANVTISAAQGVKTLYSTGSEWIEA